MNRLGLLCLFSLSLFVFSLPAQINQEWLACYGSDGNDEAIASCFDSQGNFYVAGTFKNTITIGSNTLSSGIHNVLFIAKFNSSRQPVWAVQSFSSGGTARNARATGIVADSQGNLYLTGTFTISLVLSGISVTSAGGEDIFVAKLNSSGGCVWLKRTGGGDPDFAKGICLSNAGLPVVCAYTEGNYSLLGTNITSLGNSDVTVFKLSSTGDLADYAYFGSANQDRCNAICSLPGGGYAICGSYAGQISFGATILAGLGNEAFICKLDEGLNPLWALNTVGSEDQEADALCADANYIYMFGNYANSFSLASCSLANLGSALFGAKLDLAGNCLWLSSLGSSTDSNLNINSACLSSSSELFLAGYSNAAFVVPGLSITHFGGNDAMLMKLSADGLPAWIQNYGGEGLDKALSICANGNGEILLTGSFSLSANFNGNSISSAGLKDAFCMMLTEANPNVPAIPQNVSLQKLAGILRLSWDPVNLSETGQTLSVTGYKIYYCADPSGNDFQLLGQTSATSYDLSGAAITEDLNFFRVKAIH